MASAPAPIFKTLSMTDSCVLSLPSILTSKNVFLFRAVPSKPIKLHISSAHSSQFTLPLPLKKTKRRSSVVSFVAQTSDWAQQEEDTTIIFEQEGLEQEPNEPMWENQGVNESETSISDLEAEGEDSAIEAGESGEDGVFVERDGEDEVGYVEPPEEAKIFVGNLPYDADSHKLAMIFEKAGVVEIAEVIYNRDTDQSRGFGFVTMSTIEEADKAVEMFNRYELGGRLLTVNKASAKGTRQERPPRVFEPAFRIYVGNLPWDVDNASLEQVFSQHGKVLQARVLSDRETGRSRGFGFVTMSSEAEMNDAIAALDGQSIGGRAIRVNVAQERTRPSSF